MEFPELGRNCTEKTCNKLDFLPVRCDACEATFCIEHYPYIRHNCSSGLRKDVQVPVCPLCMQPVPTAQDVSPDVSVSRHMDQFCKPETRKIYTNQCTMRGCKKKELIPVVCSSCKRNFCLTHRHTADHNCDPANAVRDQRANAAQKRIQSQATTSNKTTTAQRGTTNSSNSSNNSRGAGNLAQAVQGSMTEDEALAHALALSLEEPQSSPQRTNNNPVTVGGATVKDKCSLS